MNTKTSGEIPAKSLPILRSLVVIILVGLTVVTCLFVTPVVSKSETGVVMELPNSIDAFWGTNQPVSEAELALLPADTEFAKKLYEDGRGNSVNCQIVLAGAEKRSIHRPERCLPGQGWTLKVGEVVPVELEDGKKLNVMKLTIARPIMLPNGQQKELTSLYYYWFVGKETTTPRHLTRVLKTNLDMLLHNTNHRWAYVIVSAPVLEGFVPGGKNAEETREMLEDFIRNLAPKIMKPEVLANLGGKKQKEI